MQQLIRPQIVLRNSATFTRFLEPLNAVFSQTTPLTSRGNHPLTLYFEHNHHSESVNLSRIQLGFRLKSRMALTSTASPMIL